MISTLLRIPLKSPKSFGRVEGYTQLKMFADRFVH